MLFTARKFAIVALSGLATTGLVAAALAGSAASAAAPIAAPAASAAVCSSLPTPPKSPRAYADKIVKAWAAGEKFSVGCLANATIGDYLFGESAKGTGWTYVTDGNGHVTYRNRAGAQLVIRVDAPSTTFHRAIQVTTKGLNGKVNTYTDNLIRAWGIGSKDHALGYATKTTVDKLWAFSGGGPGGGGWVRGETTAYAGSVFVNYTCEGALVSPRVNPVTAASGARQAVYNLVTNGAD